MIEKYILKVLKLSSLIFCFSMIISMNAFASQLGDVKMTGNRDFVWPVPSCHQISSCYKNMDYKVHANQGGHKALDIPGAAGATVVAAYDGTVENSYWSNSFGNVVLIKHTNYKGKTLYTQYNHMSSRTVSKGDRVKAGSKVGTVGKTGNVDGAHLDFIVMLGGYTPWRNYSIDPFANQIMQLPSGFSGQAGSAANCCYQYVNEVKALYSKPSVSINLTVKQTNSTNIRSDWNAVAGADQYFLEVKDSNGNRLEKVWTKALGWDFYDLTTERTYTVRLDVLKNGKSLGEVSKNIYLKKISSTPTPTRTISDGDYKIVSSLDSSKYIDVAGTSKNCCANVQLWQSKGNASQIWRIKYLGDGYYSIQDKNSGRYLDVANGSTTSGTNVWIYDGNSSDSQKWIISEKGDDGYTIISKRGGLALDVNGAKKTNGTNIQVYVKNGTNAQKWNFVASGKSIGKTVSNGYYQIRTSLDTSKLVDVSGAGKNNSTNVQLWQKTSKAAQTWKVTYVGDGYYSIMDVNSGKYLDVAGGRKKTGTNVQIYTKNDTDSQRWIIKPESNGRYSIISKVTGHYLDCCEAKSANGTNIQTWYNYKSGNYAQLWKFTKVYNLSKPKVSTPTSPKKKQIKAKWNKVTGAKGYVVQFSTSKSFSKVSKSITTSSLTATYTSATKGKYYYVRVRAYAKTGLGNTIYGVWSSVSKRVKSK